MSPKTKKKKWKTGGSSDPSYPMESPWIRPCNEGFVDGLSWEKKRPARWAWKLCSKRTMNWASTAAVIHLEHCKPGVPELLLVRFLENYQASGWMTCWRSTPYPTRKTIRIRCHVIAWLYLVYLHTMRSKIFLSKIYLFFYLFIRFSCWKLDDKEYLHKLWHVNWVRKFSLLGWNILMSSNCQLYVTFLVKLSLFVQYEYCFDLDDLSVGKISSTSNTQRNNFFPLLCDKISPILQIMGLQDSQ